LSSQVAVWLYGSLARGDANTSSDADILLVSDDGEVPAHVRERYRGRRISISRYNWCELARMASYGSLFLVHLKIEGIPLWSTMDADTRVRLLLTDLPPYSRARRDVRAFVQSLDDIAMEIVTTPSPHFELATLAALVRRVGILGSYLLGQPRFDRMGPVAQVVRAWGLPTCIATEFGELYRYRLLADGGCGGVWTCPPRMLPMWIDRARLLLQALEEYVDA
jgi:hypothetical protein